MKIEGIPDGWLPVRFDYAVDGEAYVKGDGEVTVHVGARPTQAKRLIVRKIEKPKRYRPFANAAEFEPHRDRWFRVKMNLGHAIRTSAYDDRRHWSGEECDTWEKMFADYEFENGTPFGVEVVE